MHTFSSNKRFSPCISTRLLVDTWQQLIAQPPAWLGNIHRSHGKMCPVTHPLIRNLLDSVAIRVARRIASWGASWGMSVPIVKTPPPICIAKSTVCSMGVTRQ
jgi:hypothetical protein